MVSGLVWLCAAAGAEAGVDRWTPIGRGSGNVQALAADPTSPGVLYTAAGPAGIYRSADGAASWTWRGAPIGNWEEWAAVVLDPNDPARLYAATQHADFGTGAVWTSGDGGASWRQLLRRRDGFNAVAVSRDGTLLAAGELAEVYRSTDGGATWSIVLRPQDGAGGLRLQLAFDPLAPEVAYVGANEGLWRSADGGGTWRRIGVWPSGEAVAGVAALVFPGTRPGLLYALMRSRIYRSTDGGLTWSGGVLVSGGFIALAVHPGDSATVFAAGFQVWVSHDGGDTAEEVSSQFPHRYFPTVTALATSPASPGSLYAAVPGEGVLVSRDGARSWSIADQRGLSAQRVYPFYLGFEVGLSGRLYHQPYQDGTVFRSHDRGATWSPLGPPVPITPTALVEEAGAPERLWVASASSGLHHSADGGATWSPSTLNAAAAGYVQAVVSPAPGVLLAGGCGAWRSDDGGRRWTQVLPCRVGEDGGLASRWVQRLGTSRSWPGRAWAEIAVTADTGFTRALVLLSRDAGRTWRTLARAPGSAETPLVAAAGGVIYLNRGHVLQRSDDGGATWTLGRSAGDRIQAIAVDAADPDVVSIATLRRGVLRSADGGATWHDANAGLARMGRRWIMAVIADPAVGGAVYALPWQGGIFRAEFREP